MLVKSFIFLCMFFGHIVDDYYLQGWLASAKQKTWWEENAPDELYRNDYKLALFMHAFSWTFVMMLPAAVYSFVTGGLDGLYLVYFILNIVVHMCVDNLKANKKVINLVVDQSVHMLQIFATWWYLIVL